MKNRNAVFTAILLACFALWPAPTAFAVSPAPDGGYAGGNTAEGTDALLSLTSGIWDTALGFQALNHDTTGKNNTATGIRALFSNTSGSNDTAIGVYALYGNTIGWFNSAVGAFALTNNAIGNYNTATGYGALNHNTGDNNTAVGFGTLFRNTTGISNTASGYVALNNNTTGGFNTAEGVASLVNNTTGNFNTALGQAALAANITGSFNTALGAGAGLGVTTADHVICVGSGGANVSNSCFIGTPGVQGNVYVAGIYGAPISGGTATAVYIDSDGKLGTVLSSARFKQDIHGMDKASEAVLALRPVIFCYKKELDPKGIVQFGLIAEDVEKINPALAVRDKQGKPYSVRYDQVNAMLLNEFLKEHRKVEEQGRKAEAQEATVTQLKKGMEVLTAQLKEQAAQIQKVSAEVEMGKRATKVVLNNR